jgi:hypothetical protein
MDDFEDDKTDVDIQDEIDEELGKLNDLDDIENKVDDDVESVEEDEDEDEDDAIVTLEAKNITKGKNKTHIPIDIRTQDHPTLFEYAAMMKIRTNQINQDGGMTYAQKAKNDSTSIEKAQSEFNEGLKVLKIVRTIGNNSYVVK